jgi:hypothetical protein
LYTDVHISFARWVKRTKKSSLIFTAYSISRFRLPTQPWSNASPCPDCFPSPSAPKPAIPLTALKIGRGKVIKKQPEGCLYF